MQCSSQPDVLNRRYTLIIWRQRNELPFDVESLIGAARQVRHFTFSSCSLLVSLPLNAQYHHHHHFLLFTAFFFSQLISDTQRLKDCLVYSFIHALVLRSFKSSHSFIHLSQAHYITFSLMSLFPSFRPHIHSLVRTINRSFELQEC